MTRMRRLMIRAVVVLTGAMALAWWMYEDWGAYGFAAGLLFLATFFALYPLALEKTRQSPRP